ncbi:MAG: hypothetical protein KKF27_20785 [Gammaproteobacteria bacterium]|uniref:Uncharacterized protein n=1 Tax=viral metagenome TaxID=1070528 RepID=A0A6M3JA54_9ZZZZ|nr:hypothetical protein [Gammaproteobacteria bacterium]MBU2685686.1 hypothetical protein [Gammaproteobacteria bacterium]
MQTEKIELDGGAWWEIRTVYTVGMARRSEELLKPFVKPRNVDKVVSGEAKTLEYDVNVEELDLFEAQRTLVFAATVKWSYGGVTWEVFNDEVPQKDYQIVSRRCDELFGSVPLPVTAISK